MTKKRKKKIVKITTELLGSILLMILLTIYINIQTNIPNNKVNIITADESQNVILEEKDILQIHFFDQTCPIMIQKLNYIFARKPLISSEI